MLPLYQKTIFQKRQGKIVLNGAVSRTWATAGTGTEKGCRESAREGCITSGGKVSRTILRPAVTCLHRFRFAGKGHPIGGTRALIAWTAWQVVNLALTGPVNLSSCCVFLLRCCLRCSKGTGSCLCPIVTDGAIAPTQYKLTKALPLPISGFLSVLFQWKGGRLVQ